MTGPRRGAARALAAEALAARTTSSRLEDLGFAGLAAACARCADRFRPERAVGCDPRHGLPVAYSPVRGGRLSLPGEVCVVCDEQTCPAVDVAVLPGDDRAWLTPNLYPIVFPHPPADAAGEPPRWRSTGVHLVHWSSLRHDGGLPGADRATSAALLGQLARAEAFLLHEAPASWPVTGPDHRGHAGVIKNRGRRVGGSVVHDHQQILATPLPFAGPPATRGLGAHLREVADRRPELVVDRVDGLATTIVPPFAHRPLHAFVMLAVPAAGWLHHLDAPALTAAAFALARLARSLDELMTRDHGEPAWNMVCHAGPGCGPVFEVKAATQPLGGYEHLGLYLSEERPETSAERLRSRLPAG